MISNKNKFKLATVLVAVISLALFCDFAKASDITTQNIIDKTNQIRVLQGLEPLKVDQSLSQAANLKSVNMINRNYFDHYKFGLTPWIIIKNAGYDYDLAGENLAMDFKTSEGVVDAWLNSPTHRKNILNDNFEDIGVGIVKGEFTDEDGSAHQTIMVTQMFGRKKTNIITIANHIFNRIVDIF